MNRTYRVFFEAALAEQRKITADYEADVTDWYENGDGRSPQWVDSEESYPWGARQVNIGGQGYRYPYCRHGASLWTDYDNICGGCEDSYTDLQLASGRARAAYAEQCARLDWLKAGPKSLPDDVRTSLMWWALENMPGIISPE